MIATSFLMKHLYSPPAHFHLSHPLSSHIADGFVPNGFEIGDFIVISVANSVVARLQSQRHEDLPTTLQKALDSPVGLTGFVGADGHVHDDFLALLDAACEGTKVSGYAVCTLRAHESRENVKVERQKIDFLRYTAFEFVA